VAQTVNPEQHDRRSFTSGLERAKGTTVGTDDYIVEVSLPATAPTRSLRGIGARLGGRERQAKGKRERSV
jgi:hypothetical protein